MCVQCILLFVGIVLVYYKYFYHTFTGFTYIMVYIHFIFIHHIHIILYSIIL